MKLNVEVLGSTEHPPDVLSEEVEAGHLDVFMLVYDPDADEVDIVASEPEAFQKDGAGGRPERWVRLLLADVEDPFEAPATGVQLIVYGAEPEGLQPMLDADLLTFAQEALAHNGLCSELVDDDQPAAEPGGEVDERPVYCGLPSDPGSRYRACAAHDQARREQDERIIRREYPAGTYGPIPAPV